tara:strand:+ start:342 stop:518 length:177 start_codon:yes stop_codon:yes gene_type:complete
MENINEIITRLERKRIRKEYQHETVFERMKRMFPNRTDEEILRAIDNYDNREKVEEMN